MKSMLTTRRILILVIAVLMSLFQLYTAGIRPLPGVQQRAVHLSFALALVFLLFPFKPKSDEAQEEKVSDENRRVSFVDIILIAVSFFLGIYVFWEWEALSFRTGMPNLLDSLCSLLGILVVMEATRRVIGWSILIIALVGFLYLALGTHLPTYLAHTGFGFAEVINFTFFSTEGVLGAPLAVSATTITTFIIFGAFLNVSGAGPLFIDMGLAAFGKFRGGPAKAAVVASCLFGMITGSQVATVAAVGVFTIPLMIKTGYKPITAATISALAGTGGMLVPPVMGAVAFIIPEMIGGTYWDVCKAALVPGLLFYMCVYMIVELQAAKQGIKGLPREAVPSMRKTLIGRIHMLLPIVVLIYAIGIMRLSPVKAGFWSIIACVLASQISATTRMDWRKIMKALESGARGTLIVAVCCASAGLITGSISMSGMGERFSDVLIQLSGGGVIPLLFLTMIASLIIGLPLPPVTCYLILAVLAAPALIKIGVNPMAAHLFVFFFGALGNISPPSAPTSFAAAGIAGTDPVKTTNLTFLYVLPAFLVPYLYIFNNGLLLMGAPLEIIMVVFAAFVGIGCMTIAFNGFLFRNLNWIERGLTLAGGILVIYPGWMANVLGYAIVCWTLISQIIAAKRTAPA
jgi:TRAP transporter 4TM/12TM fusion protein